MDQQNAEPNTISEGLDRYSIGQKLRRLRLRKSMGLVELGQHSRLSPALLSKLERGLMYPTLPTLLRIAMVFSVGLEYFFNPEPKPVLEVVRKADRMRFPEEMGGTGPAYFFENLNFSVSEPALNAYYADFEPLPESDVRRHSHPKVEFLYVLSGGLEMRVGETCHQLEEGDAVYFDSSVAHGYRSLHGQKASALVVTTA